MFIGLITCPYYGDTDMFMDGKWFETEKDLIKVFSVSHKSHYDLEVKELKKAPALKDIPVHYALCLMKDGEVRCAMDWDEKGQSVGGLYCNVPKDVRDEAMVAAKKKYPDQEIAWIETYNI